MPVVKNDKLTRNFVSFGYFLHRLGTGNIPSDSEISSPYAFGISGDITSLDEAVKFLLSDAPKMFSSIDISPTLSDNAIWLATGNILYGPMTVGVDAALHNVCRAKSGEYHGDVSLIVGAGICYGTNYLNSTVKNIPTTLDALADKYARSRSVALHVAVTDTVHDIKNVLKTLGPTVGRGLTKSRTVEQPYDKMTMLLRVDNVRTPRW
jgi:hypothetical protein